MAEDPHSKQSDEAEIDADRAERAANLFDLRRIIGGVFLASVVQSLTILGITESSYAEIEKAAGININLYAGLRGCWSWALYLPGVGLLPTHSSLG